VPDAILRISPEKFDASSQTIRNWVAQAGFDDGHGRDGLTTAERDELNRLRWENRQLRQEHDILEGHGLVRMGDRHDPVRIFRFMSANQSQLSRLHHGPGARRLDDRLLCLASASAVAAGSMPICCVESAQRISPRKAPMVLRVSMPSCAIRAFGSPASGWPG
jgi:hypothetical protein